MAKSKQPFEARGEFVAARDFRYNGISHSRGSAFPWRRMAIGERALHRLFLDGYIAHPGSKAKAVAPEKPKDIVAPVVMFDPAKHTVKMGMRGPAELLDGETTLLRVSRKEGKRLMAIEEAVSVNLDEVVL